MTELLSIGDPPSGYQKINYESSVQFPSFVKLITNLFSRTKTESDTNHPVIIILDKSAQSQGSKLGHLPHKDKVLLLQYFFNHLNLIIIESDSLSDASIIEELNTVTAKINHLISNRISRIQTWTGTGASIINDIFSQGNDQERFSIEKIICTMSCTLNIHANKSQATTHHLAHLKDLMMEEINFTSLLSNSSPQHLSKLCHLVGHWSFPAHELTNDDLVYCVYLMLTYALTQAKKYINSSEEFKKDFGDFHIPSSNELLGFVFMMRDVYRNGNPFHNFRHAVDVMQACFQFLIKLDCLPPFSQLENDPNADELRYVNMDEKEFNEQTELVPKANYKHAQPFHMSSSISLASSPSSSKSNSISSSDSMSSMNSISKSVTTIVPASPHTTHLNPLQTLGILVAALGHDVGHPGLTNAFMIKHEAPTSLVFNERSVLESFHSSVFINKILTVNWPSLLSVTIGNGEDVPLSIKDLIVSSILATDMAEHFEYIYKLTTLKGDSRRDNNMVKLISSLLIKCADISNVTRPLRVSSQWAVVLAREFEEVASLENCIINNQSPNNQEVGYSKVPVELSEILKLNPEIHKGQIFFITTFAENLFSNIAKLLPELSYTSTIIKDNKEFWLSKANNI